MNLKGHVQFMIKDTLPQEHPASSKPPAKSYIFESVLDALKINRFQPNFKHSNLRSYWDHPKHHQEHQPQSGTSKSSSTPGRTIEMSSIFEGVLDAFKLNRFQPNFKYCSNRAYACHPKRHQGHQPQSGMSIIIIDSSNNCNNVIYLWGWSWCLQTQQISTKF